MGITSYISINGIIVGETISGISRAYGLDALGSIVATYTGSSVENTYQYKPFGGLLAKSGVAADPLFLWNGGSGYRATLIFALEYYVRRRHFSSQTCLWSSSDPLWPQQPPYIYVRNRPIRAKDPSGLAGIQSGPCCWCPAPIQVETPTKQYGNGINCGLDNILRIGSKFVVNLDTFPLPSTQWDSSFGPLLEWWECSNIPLTSSDTGGQWVNRTSDLDKQLCPDSYRKLQYRCDKDTKGAITDVPNMKADRVVNLGQQLSPGSRLVIRHLFILVRMMVTGQCPYNDDPSLTGCPDQAKKIYQWIAYDPSKVGNVDADTTVGSWPNDLSSTSAKAQSCILSAKSKFGLM